MTCARYGGTETAERYVTGAMTEAEQAVFEEHFFECEPCLAEVRLLQDLQASLRAAASPDTHDRGLTGASVWTTGLAAAAVLVLASGLWFWWSDSRPLPSAVAPEQTDGPRTPEPPITSPTAPTATPFRVDAAPSSPTPKSEPAPSRDTLIARLAMVTPPPYYPLTTRGDAERERAEFDAAMAHYVDGRYADAARGLGALAERSPDLVHVQFFLGVSDLMAGRPGPARDALQRVVTSNVSPFSDEAHFYLAKAALAEKDVAAATEALSKAIDLDAGPEGEAARMLASLRFLPR